ncbi:1-acyl-sn-glycerol-3-phosphate acyltransferase [Clostridium sp. 19966]|uniref:lysophospholipid acyltransferase family protein n=1 Tax=Clostridium sp. 19966 TaxID=2768166 RepID=UPI0028DF09E2|nr:lysophospholipid acyltransferase family protein [Clostridium sp. 19966]MDT8718512.1 1-acyl-sn-glycerol-3-phosphate acyltransferase [Clostridium sp. 19966]
MLPPIAAKIISKLPKGASKFVCKSIADYYLSKYASIKINGMENLSNVEAPVIFVGNHLSNSDGLILSKVLKNQDVSFVAGIKLSNDPVTNIGINVVKTINIKPNTADKEALTKIIDTIKKEKKNIFIFPEGTRSRSGEMIEAKKGIILIAKITKVSIVPIGVSGSEKLLPIDKEGNMAREKFQSAEVRVNIGKPIKLVEKNKDEDRHEYEKRALYELMHSIALLLPEEYRGVYK